MVDANDTFLRMTGYTHEDVRRGRMNWMQMTPPEYPARTQRRIRNLPHTGSIRPLRKSSM